MPYLYKNVVMYVHQVYTCSCNGVMDYPEFGLQVMAMVAWLVSISEISKLKA